MANVTLLSDLGVYDASSGIVKGVLYSIVSNVRIVDISHEVAPYDLQQAAYILGASYHNFPAGTVHIVLVDVFYSATARLVLTAWNGHYFLVPDNGLFSLMAGNTYYESWLCNVPKGERPFDEWLYAAAIVTQQLQEKIPADARLQPYTPLKLEMPRVLVQGNKALCEVIYIDRFGNVVTNMTRTQFEQMKGNKGFQLSFGLGEIVAITSHYTDVAKFALLCRFNKSDYLEICVNKGNASELLGYKVGGIYNDIIIEFT